MDYKKYQKLKDVKEAKQIRKSIILKNPDCSIETINGLIKHAIEEKENGTYQRRINQETDREIEKMIEEE